MAIKIDKKEDSDERETSQIGKTKILRIEIGFLLSRELQVKWIKERVF